MKRGFYLKIAASGISKNKKIYIPYILTCIGMVMMFYIIDFLSADKIVASMKGGPQMQIILGLGTGVIGVFAVIFLFYTNSFLMRRRKKEFGLYNILGMDKKNLTRVLLWENVIISAVGIIAGLICGILFSKLAQLLLMHAMGGESSYRFTVEIRSIILTVILFAVIFTLILLKALGQVHLSKPVELLRSEAVGEKPPKANWFLGIAGVIILGIAYYIALTIEDPMSTIMMFFVAVLLVIIATYLVFIAGSVMLCKILQKCKGYYYKTNHFVSVSSLSYRMKRGGAGLASICILCTIVLVMLSSTTCLYIGTEDSLLNRYPRDFIIDTASEDTRHTQAVRDAMDRAVNQYGLSKVNPLSYRYLEIGAYEQGDKMILNQDSVTDFSANDFSKIKQLIIVPIEDYNHTMGVNETLEADEVLIYSKRAKYPHKTLAIENCETLRVKKTVHDFSMLGKTNAYIASTIYIFVPNMDVMNQINAAQAAAYGKNASAIQDYWGFDLNCSADTKIAVYNTFRSEIKQMKEAAAATGVQFPNVSADCREQESADFYSLYTGLFILGILLGIVFVFAAVLIMYYKQITEGYEDQDRFGILQKVGMTKSEVRKSINSQMLTVFFLPLIAAGLHVAMAFNMISKLLTLFSITNTGLLITVTAGGFLVFAIFYVIVYKATSRAYYGIVSAKKDR